MSFYHFHTYKTWIFGCESGCGSEFTSKSNIQKNWMQVTATTSNSHYRFSTSIKSNLSVMWIWTSSNISEDKEYNIKSGPIVLINRLLDFFEETVKKIRTLIDTLYVICFWGDPHYYKIKRPHLKNKRSNTDSMVLWALVLELQFKYHRVLIKWQYWFESVLKKNRY